MSSGIVSAGLTQHDHASTTSGNKPNQAPLKPVAGDDGAGTLWSAVEAYAGNNSSKWGMDVLNVDYGFDTHGVRVRAAAGKIGNFRFATNTTVARWTIKKTDTAEGGSDAGSDMDFQAHADTGASLGSALLLTRSNKQATFGGDAVFQTKTPATAGAAGVAGTIAWDANYIYVCTATNTWKRVAIATW